jgi:hypothetical protein
MFSLLFALSCSRDSTYLYASQQGTGDCFDNSCSFNEATLRLRAADVIYIKDKQLYPPSYPSEFSDLIEGAVQNNVTLVAQDGGTVIDGKMLTGGVMYYLENQRRFTWAKFKGFTFRHFGKLIMGRTRSWTTFPQIVFENCNFEDSTHDLFSTTGGHWVFVNCVFRNLTGRPFKALSETCVEFEDCTFENVQAVFGYGADLIFRNCIFLRTFGGRGGAIYAAKTTLYVSDCKFIETAATANGGAIYIRDSHEKYQSEISRSCFSGTKAAMNGTAVYAYLSDVNLNGNIFAGDEDSVYAFTCELHNAGNKYKADAEACIRAHQPMNEEDLFSPCDTFQRHELDEAYGNIFIDVGNPDDPIEQLIA